MGSVNNIKKPTAGFNPAVFFACYTDKPHGHINIEVSKFF